MQAGGASVDRLHVQEAAEQAATQQIFLMDHVDVCVAKREHVRLVAAEVTALQADVDALHAALKAACDAEKPGSKR